MVDRRLIWASLAWLCVIAGSALVYSAPALAVRGFSSETSFGQAGSGDGEFSEPTSVAVNSSSGEVYVVDKGNDRIEYFTATGAYIGQFNGSATPAGSFSPESIAVDSSTNPSEDPSAGDVYVVDTAHNVIDKFSATGTYLSQLTGFPNTGLLGVAVNSHGLWVVEGNGEIAEFNDLQINGEVSSVAPDYRLLEFGEGTLVTGLASLLAVDSGNNFYLMFGSYSGDLLEGFSSTGKLERLNTQYYNYHGIGLAVDESTNDLYVDIGSEVDGYEPFRFSSHFSPAIEFGAKSLGDSGGRGIAVNSSVGSPYSNYLYVADALANKVDIFIPEEPSPPAVSVTNIPVRIGPGSATVEAQIDSRGTKTSYYFQYGTVGCSESPASCVDAPAPPGYQLGPEFATQAVNVVLRGLRPSTEYHYRVVATNEKGTTYGAEATFTTYPAVLTALPDGRVYELVSQFGNEDSEVFVPEGEEFVPGAEVDDSLWSKNPFEASSDGEKVTYPGSPPSASAGGGGNDSRGFGNQYVALHQPQGGWVQEDITPPGTLEAEYEGFTSSLSTGFLVIPTVPPYVAAERPTIAPEVEGEVVGNRILYTRSLDGPYFTPTFTTVPSDRPEKSPGLSYGRGQFYARYAGSATGTGGELLESNEDLLEGEGPLEKELSGDVQTGAKEMNEVYALMREFETDVEEHNPATGPKREELEAKEASVSASDNYKQLYISVGGKLSLVNVSPAGAIDQNATYGSNLGHVVSADGSRIFWTSAEGIVYVREDGSRTVQVSQGPNAEFWTASADGQDAYYIEAGKLWQFDVDSETRLELAGPGAGVEGVLGTNETGEDGAYVYFVATEKLTTEENVAKQQAVEGGDNLYVYESDGKLSGQPKIAFIGTLSPDDGKDWHAGLERRLANLTPDGQGLVFASTNNLTGHQYPGEGSEEVYVYDANDASLYCASCRPQASGGHLTFSLNKTYAPRWISEDGDQVFFDSRAPLVAQDVNDAQDVYEWERDGSGACGEKDGCVYLISNGVEGEANLVDSSANGNDVFFTTRQRLLPEKENENEDLYDARVDGVRTITPPLCSGTGCQGVPAPAPIFATPASVTFGGVGNFSPPSGMVSVQGTKGRSLSRFQKLLRALNACHKERGRKKQAVCEARARRIYGTKAKAKKSATRGGK